MNLRSSAAIVVMFERLIENCVAVRGVNPDKVYLLAANRVRYFTDGAVIGGREFVNEAFASARERCGEKRKDGARRMRGSGSAVKNQL